MKKPTEDRGPQTKQPEKEDRIELDKHTLKDLESGAPVEEAVKGGAATIRRCL